jgi:hypothetical protein
VNPPQEVYNDVLGLIAGAQERALAMIEKQKFVFDGTGGRWEKLAFTLYTDICEMSAHAEMVLEGEDE